MTCEACLLDLALTGWRILLGARVPMLLYCQIKTRHAAVVSGFGHRDCNHWSTRRD